MTTMQLSDRQERFVREYLLDLNAAAAARRAGYADGTGGKQAATLMKHPLIRERIALALAGMFAELGITPWSLMRERARAAFFRAEKMCDEAGRLLPLNKMDADTRAALTVHHDVRPDGKTTMRIRQPDRFKALAALEKAYAQVMDSLRDGAATGDTAVAEAAREADEVLEAEATQARRGPGVAQEPREIALAQAPHGLGIAQEPREAVLAEEPRKVVFTQEPREVALAREPHGVGVARDARETGIAQAPESVGVAPEPEGLVSRLLQPQPALAWAAHPPVPELPPAQEHYDFRKDPEWMLGGRYRHKGHGLPLPVVPRRAEEAAPPAAPPRPATPATPTTPTMLVRPPEPPLPLRAARPSPLVAAVRRVFGADPAPQP